MEQQTKLFDIIFNEDEITWQSLIYKLVREEGMNPWDINISVLSNRFLDMLKTLKKMDFRVSGKIILAAAILLRIKSSRLVGEDFNNLNRLIAMTEDNEDDFFEELEAEFMEGIDDSPTAAEGQDYRLDPKTPLPRKRKVSVYDLVDALNKALEVKNRRKNRLSDLDNAPEVRAPGKQKDISEVIGEVYEQIKRFFKEKREKKMLFTQIVPSNSSREEKITSFVPLLYLDSQRKIDLFQEKHLAEIEIMMNNRLDISTSKKPEISTD